MFTPYSESELAGKIDGQTTVMLDVKIDGHALLLSACYYAMPKNLDKGSDGKSLKNPGNGSFVTQYINAIGKAFPKYTGAMKLYALDHFPLILGDDGKVKCNEKRFIEMGGDRDKILQRAGATAITWFDYKRKKDDENKVRQPVGKRLASLIKSVQKIEDLTDDEKALLRGLLEVAKLGAIDLS